MLFEIGEIRRGRFGKLDPPDPIGPARFGVEDPYRLWQF